jgi:hypothetical protein
MSLKNRIRTLYQVEKKKGISYKQSFGWYAILSVDHACQTYPYPIHPENVHNQQLKVFIGWASPSPSAKTPSLQNRKGLYTLQC